jgi:hypothetical protein
VPPLKKTFASELETVAKRNPLGTITGAVLVGVFIGLLARGMGPATSTAPAIGSCESGRAGNDETGRFSRTDPLRTPNRQIQRFLFIALAALLVASFTAAFASPVAF